MGRIVETVKEICNSKLPLKDKTVRFDVYRRTFGINSYYFNILLDEIKKRSEKNEKKDW